MKKIFTWRVIFTLGLLTASAVTYFLHYLIFHDLHHIFLYLVGDIAFLFLNVLLVTLVIERLLAQREKQAMMKKLNMVIGNFFSEVGIEFLKKSSLFSENTEMLAQELLVSPEWDKKDFHKAMTASKTFPYNIRIRGEQIADLRELRRFLVEKRPFLLTLLENPNLLEHERFTDLLWAVFHLAEELTYRPGNLEDLPEADILHLGSDLKRAYSQITGEWIAYSGHLKENYPFLFSLAARINPFSPYPSAVVVS